MSKGGGAGKVYFVLYLAVVLELLIIIVERDEAEEGLLQKQKETMKIVESILSQLQSGAGTEGINTRPQDEITIPPAGVNIKEVLGADLKPYRKYIVEVGVTDVSTSLKRVEGESEKEYVQRLKTLIKLGNVRDIEYQVFYNSSEDPDNAPPFPDTKILRDMDLSQEEPGFALEAPDGSSWELLGIRRLVLDEEAAFNNMDLQNITLNSLHPVYPKESEIVKGPNMSPDEVPEDSIFCYSEKESFGDLDPGSVQDLQKRAFVVNFKPPNQAGWYKLRFASRTNMILGVRAGENIEELDDETTVNIGTVQLTVKDLRKVQKELLRKLDKYSLPLIDILTDEQDIDKFDEGLKASSLLARDEDDAVDLMGKIQLYGYICKLLAPGMSSKFDQNTGAIEFDIRVITPKVKVSEPTLQVPKYTATFDKAPGVFDFSIAPYQDGGKNVVSGVVKDVNGQVVSNVICRPADELADYSGAPPVQGFDRTFRAYVEENLPAGKYTLEMKHQIGGRQDDEISEYEVFESKLSQESENKISGQLTAFSYYGYKIGIDAMPTSGGKIKSNQFRIYLSTDLNNQPVPIEGLSVLEDQRVELSSSANTVKARVTWIQPFTGTEIDLYPERTFEIKQEEPSISTRTASPEYSGTDKKLKVTITGIAVTPPITGSSENAEINIKCGSASIVDGLKTYSIAVSPSIEGDPESGYSIYFELSGKLERGENKVRGTITIPITAYATNPVNGKSSEEITQNYPVKINYEPSSSGRNRGRRR